MNLPSDVAAPPAEADWLKAAADHIQQAQQNIAEGDLLMAVSHACLLEEAAKQAVAQVVEKARAAGKTWREIAIFAGEPDEDRNFQPVWKRMTDMGVPAKRRKGGPGGVSSQE